MGTEGINLFAYIVERTRSKSRSISVNVSYTRTITYTSVIL